MAIIFRFRAVVWLVGAALLVASGATPASAQDEETLRQYFEGKRVTVTIDMPGTSDGVDIQVDSGRPLDYQRYGDHLKAYGVAVRADQAATVTLLKIKKDVIEVQLNGGGFGTFNDDSSTSVSLRPLEKSTREKSLEREIDDESNPRRRRELERQLDDLRVRREIENRRIEALRIDAEERRKERVAEQRLRGGSRFNLRYDGRVPSGITPRDVMAALAAYVAFPSYAFPDPDRRQHESALRKGMTTSDAERALGRATASSERAEGQLTVVTLVFGRGDERVAAEFVEDVLVRVIRRP